MNRFVLLALCSGLGLVALGSILMHGEPSKVGRVGEEVLQIIPPVGHVRFGISNGCIFLKGSTIQGTAVECSVCLEPEFIVFRIQDSGREYRFPVKASDNDGLMQKLVTQFEVMASMPYREFDFFSEIYSPHFFNMAIDWEYRDNDHPINTCKIAMPMSDATRARWIKLLQLEV